MTRATITILVLLAAVAFPAGAGSRPSQPPPVPAERKPVVPLPPPLPVAVASVDRAIAKQICAYESWGHDPHRVPDGSAGERGWCQVKPATARMVEGWNDLPRQDLRDPDAGLLVAALYVGHARREMLRSCGYWTERGVRWAYNEGLGRVYCDPPVSRYTDESLLWSRAMEMRRSKEHTMTLVMR